MKTIIATIIAAIALGVASPVGATERPNLEPQTWGIQESCVLHRAYQDLLERDADQAGFNYWAEHIRAGWITLDDAIVLIDHSVENGTPDGVDSARIDGYHHDCAVEMLVCIYERCPLTEYTGANPWAF